MDTPKILTPGEALATPEEKLKVAVENMAGVVQHHDQLLGIVAQMVMAIKPIIDKIQVNEPPKAEEKKEEKKDK